MSSSSNQKQNNKTVSTAAPAEDAVSEFVGMKFLGVDYFRVIYVSVTVLILLMVVVYFTA